MSERPTSPDDLAKAIARLLTVRTETRVSYTGTSGNTGDDEDGGSGFENPMTVEGSMIRGGEDGAALDLPPGTAGDVLAMVAGIPAWTDPDTLGIDPSGLYRQYVWEIDGSGGWSFVEEDDGTGQMVPVFELLALE